MKTVFNETQTTVILAGGRLKLAPKGAPGKADRKTVTDEIAARPDVIRFHEVLKKISILPVEAASTRELQETKQAAAKAPTPPAPVPESKPEPEAKPEETEAKPEEADTKPEEADAKPEEADEKPEEGAVEADSKSKKSKKRGKRS